MRVLMIEPLKAPYIAEIGKELEDLQKAVGGLVQEIYPWDDAAALICNEEGKIAKMALNRVLYSEDGIPFDIIAGPFLLCGIDDEIGDFTDLSEELIKKYSNMFRTPEIIF